MKTAALFLVGLLVQAPAPPQADTEIRSFTPECGATHCQVTVAQYRGILGFQQLAVAKMREQHEEIERLRRANCTGGHSS